MSLFISQCGLFARWLLSPQIFQMSFECKILPDEDLESLSQSQASRNDSDFIPSNSSPPDSSGSTSGPESSQVIRGGVFEKKRKGQKHCIRVWGSPFEGGVVECREV